MSDVSSPYDKPQPNLQATSDQGEPITIRLPELRDAAALEIACADPQTLLWTSVPPGYDHERALGFINDYAPGWWQRHEGACWVIADSADDYAGQIDLRVGRDSAVADVGFLTAPHARGRGYMSAALRAVAEFGLRELGLERVEWKAHVGNEGSKRVAEKAGFQLEGVLRAGCAHRGERRDAWLAALVRTDLEAGARW
jgi:RimJ/RimL family protein N-acetyltransferase